MLRAYQLNENICWAGETLEAAIADVIKQTGLTREEIVDETCLAEYLPQALVPDDKGNLVAVSVILAEFEAAGELGPVWMIEDDEDEAEAA